MNTEIHELVYRDISRKLEALNVTKSEIARRCGVTPALVTMTMKAKRRNRSVEAAIAKALNRPVSEVFPDREHEAA